MEPSPEEIDVINKIKEGMSVDESVWLIDPSTIEYTKEIGRGT